MIEDPLPGELSVSSLELSKIADLSSPGGDFGVSGISCKPKLVSNEASLTMLVSRGINWGGVDGSLGRSSMFRWILLIQTASSERLSLLYLMHFPVVIMSCTWAWRGKGSPCVSFLVPSISRIRRTKMKGGLCARFDC